MDIRTTRLIEHLRDEIYKVNDVAHVTAETEYAAFAKRKYDDEMVMIGRPQCTVLLCRNRLKEQTNNVCFETLFYEDSTVIKKRQLVTMSSGWEEIDDADS